jgi:hypothetical protein
MDPVLGRSLNRNYTGYLVPTSADIPELETLFVGEFDEEASPLGAKGSASFRPPRSHPRSRMRSTMQPANVFGICRSQ